MLCKTPLDHANSSTIQVIQDRLQCTRNKTKTSSTYCTLLSMVYQYNDGDDNDGNDDTNDQEDARYLRVIQNYTISNNVNVYLGIHIYTEIHVI